MTERRLTDGQISAALRAHLPAEASAGLVDAIAGSVDRTAQQRPWPSFLGVVTDADAMRARRNLLLAAALLVAIAVAAGAAAGAWRLLQDDNTPRLDLTSPGAVDAFVRSSYDRMPDLSPVAITTSDGEAVGRMYVDDSGAVRLERYASSDAAEPDSLEILHGTSMGHLESLGSEKVWVEETDAISEDPRVFLLSQLEGGGAGNASDCMVAVTPGDGTSAAGWTYVGTEDILGRPAGHVTCGGGDLWIDLATRLILRSNGPARDDAYEPIAGSTRTVAVTGLTFGDQPDGLFAPAPGIATLSADAYQCRIDATACPPPSDEPTPAPVLTVAHGSLPPRDPPVAGNGWIAYSTDGPVPGVTDDSTGSDIYVVQEGVAPRVTASRDGGPTRNVCPTYSPNGSRLAFGTATGLERAVIVRKTAFDAAVDDPVRLIVPGEGPAPCPRWSSDGTRLAYLEGGTIVVRGLDGTTPTRIPGDPDARDFGPASVDDALLSPTGDRVVSVESDGATCQLVIAAPNVAAAEIVPLEFCPYAIPTWSPDGRQVLLLEDISGRDFAIHAVKTERPYDMVTIVPSVRTNGARSWPGRGDVSWQAVTGGR